MLGPVSTDDLAEVGGVIRQGDGTTGLPGGRDHLFGSVCMIWRLWVRLFLEITRYSLSSTRVYKTAWARWAFDLWGLADGQADVDDDCRGTRRWFIDTARAL
jgi:hypothetical protein